MNFILPPCSQPSQDVSTSGCHFLQSCRPFGPQSFSGRLCAVKPDTLRSGRASFAGQCACVPREHGDQHAPALIATACGSCCHLLGVCAASRGDAGPQPEEPMPRAGRQVQGNWAPDGLWPFLAMRSVTSSIFYSFHIVRSTLSRILLLLALY